MIDDTKRIKRIVSEIEMCVKTANTKEELIELLSRVGYGVRWGETAENITFTCLDGKKIRNKYLTQHSTCDLSVEGLRKRYGMTSLEEVKKIKKNRKEKKEKIEEFCEKYSIEKDNHSYIYVLGLENDNYYVGFTNSFKNRMKDHFIKGNSAIWTGLHVPVTIVKVIDLGKIRDSEGVKYETAETIECMLKYGFERVRGGDFLSENQAEIMHLLNTHGFGLRNGKLSSISKESKIYRDKRIELYSMKVCYEKKE